MTPALQSYTPTPRPLNYDALEGAEGCGPETGNEFFGTLPFARMCVYPHNPNSTRFGQPDTVSYTFGPIQPGTSIQPFNISWSAWISTVGVRVSKLGYIIPTSPTLGSPSALFPVVTDATKVTHCFDSAGLLHMAVERPGTGFIELKWYTDNLGTMRGLFVFGNSPMLFNTGSVEVSAGVVMYYLRGERPFVLLARFSNDNFAVEHEVALYLRSNLTRLISISSMGTEVRLYGSDAKNHDVTLYSPPYSQRLSDECQVGTMLDEGVMTQLVTNIIKLSDKARVGVVFSRSFMKLGEVVAPMPTKIDKTKLGVAFDFGEMNE